MIDISGVALMNTAPWLMRAVTTAAGIVKLTVPSLLFVTVTVYGPPPVYGLQRSAVTVAPVAISGSTATVGKLALPPIVKVVERPVKLMLETVPTGGVG